MQLSCFSVGQRPSKTELGVSRSRFVNSTYKKCFGGWTSRISKYVIVLIVLVLNFIFVNNAFAVICTSGTTCTTNTQWGFVGNNSVFRPLATNKSGFDTIQFTNLTDIKIQITSGQTVGRLPYLIWQNVEFGDPSLTSNMTVNFLGGSDATIDLGTGHTRTLELGILNLDHVDATIENGVTLNFAASSNGINLESSSMTFEGQGARAVSSAPFTITSISGDNEFKKWYGQIRSQSTTIDVQSGSTLLFDACVNNLQPYSIPADQRLYFSSPVTGTVNNATMTFNYSDVYFNSSAFNFMNSALALTGSDSKVEFEKVSFDTSTMTLGNNTTVTASEMTLADTTITLNAGARVNSDIVLVTHATTLAGSDYTGTGLYANLFDIKANVTFNQDGSRVNVTDWFWMRSGAKLNVDGSDAWFFAEEVRAFGNNIINITNGGWFTLTGGIHSLENFVTFNVAATSKLIVASGADLRLGLPGINHTRINNDGAMQLYGILSDSGTIAGSGAVIVYSIGQIAPGRNFSTSTERIGTIVFENSVIFESGSSGSQYYAHIDVTGGTETNDLVQYDDNDFDITNLSNIAVQTASAKTADELNGKSFRIISSLPTGSSGSLITGGSYPTIVEGSEIPALIDFTVSNEGTYGHGDITLNAAKQGVSSLLTHSSVNTANTANTVNLLAHAANNGNAVIINAMNNLVNGQVGAHFNSIHAEPYSSYMTVSLEQIDLVLNSVMSNVSTGRRFSPGKSSINKDRDSGNAFWMDNLYVDGDVDGENNSGNFSYKLLSTTIGQDLRRSNDNVLGVYFSYGTQKMDEHDVANQDLRGDVYHLGGYLNMLSHENWDIHSVLGYAYGDHKSRRNISLGNYSSEVDADYDSHAVYTGVKGVFTWIENEKFTLSPEIGLGYSFMYQGEIRESGDPSLGLKVDETTAQSFVTSSGINVKFAAPFERFKFNPQAFLKYEHDWYANANDKHEIDAALISHPENKQKFVGRNRGADAIIYGFGITSNVSSALQASGGVIFSKTSHGREFSLGLNFEYKW